MRFTTSSSLGSICTGSFRHGRVAETGPGKKIWMHWRNWWHLMQTVDYLTIIIVAFFFISNSKFSPLSLTCKRLEIFKRGSQQSPVHCCPFFCFVHRNSASCIFVDGHCNNLLLEHANNLEWNRGLGLAKPTKISLPSEILRLRAPPRTLCVATDRRAVLLCTCHKIYTSLKGCWEDRHLDLPRLREGATTSELSCSQGQPKGIIVPGVRTTKFWQHFSRFNVDSYDCSDQP